MRRVARKMLTAIALATLPVSLSTVASPASELSDAYNAQTDPAFRKGLQIRLTWTGDYAGPFTGTIDTASLRAIRDFEARHGMKPDGVIDEPMLKLLISQSDEAQSPLGVKLVDDVATGVRLPMPLSLVSDHGATAVGSLWRSEDQAVEIESIRIDSGQTLDGLYAVLSEPTQDRTVTAAENAGDWFTVSGKEQGRSYFMRFAARDGDLRGFSVSYPPADARELDPYVRVASNMFEPFASEPQPPLVASNEPRTFSSLLERRRESASADTRYAMASIEPGRPNLFEMPPVEAPATAERDPVAARSSEFDMAGSGFVVSSDGWLLTNAHVVKACKTVTVGSGTVAQEIRIDPKNDLALIKVGESLGEPLKISAAKPRLGEDILALGYPLRSILADSLNVTRGNVSSLLGLMNDPRYLQISAPVQPGNSGGPLVDLAGRVVGVVTAKLNAVAVADATGDIPQSINFAIRPDAVTSFLHANDVAFRTADPDASLESVPDATAAVKDSVFPVVCFDH
ncbi:serine protease [Aurantimonas sp. VKM B-3413]|uniref:serine protease n=1 Tax=Aurantimonas sp. VKM B-3413 TaxID=2779401 RepID=UPI001E4E5605|nr:serine protease [Aurantimonas sp. VKM B-3413]MCB8840113.1 serine protease [Aurantimonas sp. VKM B-3413]